jgi:hypothetical protein
MAKRTVAGREAVKKELVSAQDIQGMFLLNLELQKMPAYHAVLCTASFRCLDYV